MLSSTRQTGLKEIFTSCSLFVRFTSGIYRFLLSKKAKVCFDCPPDISPVHVVGLAIMSSGSFPLRLLVSSV